MTLFQTCLISGSLGVVLQMLIKLRGLQKRAKAGNVSFAPVDYFKSDWLVIAMSFFAVIVSYWLCDEILDLYPQLQNVLRLSFVAIGYAGSSVLHAFASQAEKKILSVIDDKTDIADRKEKQGTYNPN